MAWEIVKSWIICHFRKLRQCLGMAGMRICLRPFVSSRAAVKCSPFSTYVRWPPRHVDLCEGTGRCQVCGHHWWPLRAILRGLLQPGVRIPNPAADNPLRHPWFSSIGLLINWYWGLLFLLRATFPGWLIYWYWCVLFCCVLPAMNGWSIDIEVSFFAVCCLSYNIGQAAIWLIN